MDSIEFFSKELFAFALSLFGMTKEMVQNINPLLSSDVMQLVAGIVFLVFYLRNKKHI